MVSVEAPDTTRPAARFSPTARATASGSTPTWEKNRRSSTATSSSR